MIRPTLMLIAVAALSACDKPAEPPANDGNESIVVRSESQKQLFDLNDLDRAIALKRAIGEQGLICKQIVSTGYVGRYKNMDVWTATCGDKRQWSLFISANDTVQVRLCDNNEQLGLPACKVQPGTEGGTGLDDVEKKKS